MENSFSAHVNTPHAVYQVTIMPQVIMLQNFRDINPGFPIKLI